MLWPLHFTCNIANFKANLRPCIPASQFSWPMAERKAVRSVSVSSVLPSDVAESVISLIDAAKLFWFNVIEKSLCFSVGFQRK